MKRLIVCADGTWNRPEREGNDGESTSTNVLKMLRSLNSITPDGTAQVRFYIKGVGTRDWLDRFLGGAFGIGLSENVLDCYRFLANNYCPGDEIFIFGFSRGAFTARSLAGLIGAIGFIHPRRLGKLPDGWRYYRTSPKDRDSREAQELLRRTGERIEEIPIKCIGVWDTVGALGVPVAGLKNLSASKHRFHDVTLGALVENAFHAIAIDERRKAFSPTLWDEAALREGQRVEQVWFAGVHSNVGGGYADQGLSDIALEWMVERVRAHTDLSFDEKYIAQNVSPSARGKLYDSRKSYWHFLPAEPRECPSGAILHDSVHGRRNSGLRPPYDPPNFP